VESIAEGDKQYIDRNYTFSSLGDCAGMYYIRTANNDKEKSGDSFLSFDINRGATVLVAYRHGSDLPSWLSSWSKTGDQVCGDGCSEIYKKDCKAGTVTLGGNRPGGAGNMYGVFIDAGGDATIFTSNTVLRSGNDGSLHAQVTGTMLRINGLYPDQAYHITLADARGRVSSVRKVPEGDGMVFLSTTTYPCGVYLLTIRSSESRHNMTVVLN